MFSITFSELHTQDSLCLYKGVLKLGKLETCAPFRMCGVFSLSRELYGREVFSHVCEEVFIVSFKAA